MDDERRDEREAGRGGGAEDGMVRAGSLNGSRRCTKLINSTRWNQKVVRLLYEKYIRKH